MILYIRHGEDKEDQYGNDGKITGRAKLEIRAKTVEWLDKYGIPDIIYYSPYYRTYSTFKHIKLSILEYLEKNGIEKTPKFIVEPALGRFVTFKEKENGKIRRSTLKKGAIINETSVEFKKRIGQQLEINKVHLENNKNVWNITHAIILLHTAKIMNIPFKQHVNYLDVLYIK